MIKRKEKLRAKIGEFMRQYQRKAQGGCVEPNDRQNSRKIEAKIKRMKPQELDDLLNGEQDELSVPPRKKVDPMPGQGVSLRTV